MMIPEPGSILIMITGTGTGPGTGSGTTVVDGGECHLTRLFLPLISLFQCPPPPSACNACINAGSSNTVAFRSRSSLACQCLVMGHKGGQRVPSLAHSAHCCCNFSFLMNMQAATLYNFPLQEGHTARWIRCGLSLRLGTGAPQLEEVCYPCCNAREPCCAPAASSGSVCQEWKLGVLRIEFQ
eukprot:1972684-Rhodomonas_salina.1